MKKAPLLLNERGGFVAAWGRGVLYGRERLRRLEDGKDIAQNRENRG